MLRLKFLCVIFCLAFLCEAILDVSLIRHKSVRFDIFMVVINSVYSLAKSILFGTTFYGFQKRYILAWKYGWIGFAILVLEFLIVMITAMQKLPSPDCWVASVVVTIVTAVIVSILGFAWRAQKSYFISD